jgi:hypothetical protein
MKNEKKKIFLVLLVLLFQVLLCFNAGADTDYPAEKRLSANIIVDGQKYDWLHLGYEYADGKRFYSVMNGTAADLIIW